LSGANSRDTSNLALLPKCCCKSTMYDKPAIYSNDDTVSTQPLTNRCCTLRAPPQGLSFCQLNFHACK
jgi:hypothetical protein